MIGLSDNLKNKSTGAAAAAVEALQTAVSMSLNVTYLGIISRALAEFSKFPEVR